ncbi:hypothetical protein QAD02_000585 [Eretmocerus hayati]|uniref:Uncharacterized protein n=1 Tax=Eretmocerus hayati TaxID=131215 RepID=A0ACC2NFA5_9HYME|nr:hypothetical protein QAD02_000585 [Eretmocerus hayati]
MPTFVDGDLIQSLLVDENMGDVMTLARNTEPKVIVGRISDEGKIENMVAALHEEETPEFICRRRGAETTLSTGAASPTPVKTASEIVGSSEGSDASSTSAEITPVLEPVVPNNCPSSAASVDETAEVGPMVSSTAEGASSTMVNTASKVVAPSGQNCPRGAMHPPQRQQHVPDVIPAHLENE